MSDPKAVSEHFLGSQEEQWRETMQTNVAGVYFMSMAFLPLLAAGRDATPGYTSQVVNVSSISGAMKGPSAGQPAYAASKAAATHVSRMLATLYKDVGVRVNVVAPGIFPSEMTAGASGADNKSALDIKSTNPAGRTGTDTDMAATILFLAGRGGLFYNGQIVYPDGGELAAACLAGLIRSIRIPMLTTATRYHAYPARGEQLGGRYYILHLIIPSSVAVIECAIMKIRIHQRSRLLRGTSGLVVKSIVAIDGPRVRFAASATNSFAIVSLFALRHFAIIARSQVVGGLRRAIQSRY